MLQSAPSTQSTSPLFTSRNRLQIGTFGSNTARFPTLSTFPQALKAEWGETLQIAQWADRLGFEAIVPLCRFKGFGGETNATGQNFDTVAWAAGIAAATTYPAVFVTANVGLSHPVAIAKQLSTIDHISGGRVALNIVAGWFKGELDMFGYELPERETRYEIAEEWTQVVERLWTEAEPFDFEG